MQLPLVHLAAIPHDPHFATTMKALRTFFLPLLFVSVFLMGCDADSTGSSEPVDVSLAVQGMFGSQSLTTSATYDHNGAAVTIEAARVYLSDFVLTTADGQEVAFTSEPVTVPAKDENDGDITHTVTDKVLLAKNDMGMSENPMGEIPAGDYTSISFRVGIVGQDNRVDPTQFPATHPMAKQTDFNNHWSWASGYIYLRMDGEVDTDGDGAVDTHWEAHIGRDANARMVTLDTDFTVSETNNQIHVMVDYQHFIETLDLTNPEEQVTHGMDNPPMAAKVVSMLDGAFTLGGVQGQ
jgi:hypothetical protein